MSKTNTFLNMVEAAADWVVEGLNRTENAVDEPSAYSGEKPHDHKEAVDDWNGVETGDVFHTLRPDLDPETAKVAAWDYLEDA